MFGLAENALKKPIQFSSSFHPSVFIAKMENVFLSKCRLNKTVFIPKLAISSPSFEHQCINIT